jgi:fructokinase
MADIITLGELLIDMTQDGIDEQGNGRFTAYPGGAPANVAVAAARLGADTGFIGKVGDDSFGRSLAETLRKEGVNTDGLFVSDSVPTTMAIVSVDASGEREFSFYRNPGADTQLTTEEAVAVIENDLPLILHAGSLSMTTSPYREACEEALRFAKERGVIISYDPNYRAALWDTEENAVAMMKKLLPLADILKVSDEEMLMLTGTEDFEEGSLVLSGYGPRLVLVTLGSQGVFVRYGEYAEVVPGFRVKVADTNGAGDTFLGAMLMQLAGEEGPLSSIDWEKLKAMITYANRAASLTCSRHGAIPAMPTADEVAACMKQQS